MLKKKIALVMAVAMAVSALAACGNETQKESVSSSNEESVSSATVATEESVVVEEITYPEEISIFVPIGSNAGKFGCTTYNDLYWAQALEEITGTHVEWDHPASDVVGEKFNLMLASQEYTDAIVYRWPLLEGGAEQYVEEEVIVDLTELIPECMPNFNAYLEANPDIKNAVQTADGRILYIPFIRDDVSCCIFTGQVIRTDWLEKLGLEVPKTTEDFYNVLKAFKEKDPNGNGEADEIPMSAVSFNNQNHGLGNLLWAFDTHYSFYVEDGKVVWGPAEERFAEGLEYIAKLFDEGLIDVDYLLNDRTAMDSKALVDRVGSMFTFQTTKYYNDATFNDGTKVMMGIPHLTTQGNDSLMNFNPSYIERVNNKVCLAVSTDCEDPKGLLKWLDTVYSEEGITIMNYGKEGTHFEYVDGKPYTDWSKLTPEETVEIKGNTMVIDSSFPSLQQWDAVSGTYSPWGAESISTWGENVDVSGTLPAISFTSEESEQITDARAQLETYADTQINKVVIGELSMDDWDDIVAKFYEMGLDEVLEVYNVAYQRYISK